MNWPALRHVPVEDLQDEDVPIQRIRTDEDVNLWRLTRGYQDFGLFLRRLNESVVDHYLPWTGPPLSQVCTRR